MTTAFKAVFLYGGSSLRALPIQRDSRGYYQPFERIDYDGKGQVVRRKVVDTGVRISGAFVVATLTDTHQA